MSVNEETLNSLRLAVRGPYDCSPDWEGNDLDTLIWQAGEHRRQIESAHSTLDVMGTPRKIGDSTLTLAGRLDTYHKGS
jgi:hypothetical protein